MLRRTPPRPRWIIGAIGVALLAVTISACHSGSARTEAAGQSGAGRSGRSSTSGPHASGQPAGSTAPTTSTSATTVPATTTTVPATTTAPTTSEAPLPPEVGELKQGSEGPRTLAIQRALSALHIDIGKPDGEFGGNTLMGLWTFEALDGRPLTTTIPADLELRILAAKPLTMLRPELGPTHVEVDLDRQVLLVWIDGHLRVATHTSTAGGYRYCGTYKSGQHYCAHAVTPAGTYHFGRRVAGWEVAPLGKLYNPVYFNGGIAVHGEPWVGATPVSHGCVRIPMLVADYFPTLVKTGDPIIVFNGGHASVVTA